MYIPKIFSESNQKIICKHIREYSFATLLTIHQKTPNASHIPLILEEKKGEPFRLLGHMARDNEQWKDFHDQRDVLAIFQGPHSYISAGWYQTDNMVPTWNYSAVHVYGRPNIIEGTKEVVEILERLTDTFEKRTKSNWALGELDSKILCAMLKNIVAFDIRITRVEAKWKMGQNRKPQDVLSAAAKLESLQNETMKSVAKNMKIYLSRR